MARELMITNVADLDQDVADWFATDSDRPRLTLLGSVEARTHGTALAKRKAYFTELLAFLALRRNDGGATGPTIRAAFNLQPSAVRHHTSTVRRWLGTNPRTGRPYLPLAADIPATRAFGMNVYQLDEGLLVDLDLFRRLRARGLVRGREGLGDLTTALALVAGRPFDQLRPTGWHWLADQGHAAVTTMAISTVALIAVTALTEQGNQQQADAAASIALLAAPNEEATQVCLARIAEGRS